MLNKPSKCCKCEEINELLLIGYENGQSYFCKNCARKNKLLPQLPSEWIKERAKTLSNFIWNYEEVCDTKFQAILDYLDSEAK